MNVAVVTVSNRKPEQEYFTLDKFYSSLYRLGSVPITLGEQCVWGGLMTKPRLLKKWLDQYAQDFDCLIFCDSWDLVWQRSPSEAAAEWDAIGKPFCMGSERNLFPNDTSPNDYPKCRSSMRFPNSGFIICKPSDMLAVLEWMKLDTIADDHQREDGSTHHGNDQFEFQVAFLAQPVLILLDTECKFVVNLCGLDFSNFDFNGDTVKVRETDSVPFAIHANGDSKTSGVMDKVLEHLKL